MRRSKLAVLVVVAALVAALLGVGGADPAAAVEPAPTALPALPGGEVEPNDTPAAATPITSGTRLRPSIYPADEVDVFSFTAGAGEVVFAAVTVSGNLIPDLELEVLGSDGTTVIEADDDNGSKATTAPSIAGAPLPGAGTYYLRVTATNGAVRAYDLWLQVRPAGAPIELEPNDGAAQAFSGYAGGLHGAGDVDRFILPLQAGDTVFLSLDLDPLRNGSGWDGRLGLGGVGPAGDERFDVDDAGLDESPRPTIPSEALAMTVSVSGTYEAVVDSAAPGGGLTAGYRLSATVIPAATPSCRAYPSTTGAIPDNGTATFDIPVTDAAVIDRLALSITIDHNFMSDLDVVLRAPDGDRVPVFSDIGSATQGDDNVLRVVFDDAAAVSPFGRRLARLGLQPEGGSLEWFAGEPAAGTWRLIVVDDTAIDVGALQSASLLVCPRAPIPPSITIFDADFETDDDGFTHTGTGDQWERGTPATAEVPGPHSIAGLATCAGGTGCFKTNLDGPYLPNSSQDLVSPPISLVGLSGPIVVEWSQWYQLEHATFDHLVVSVEEDGGANSRRLFTWLGDSMYGTFGNVPAAPVPFPAGWGRHRADLSDYAGDTIRLRFHLDSDASTQVAGVAIDDVRVHAVQTPTTTILTAAPSPSVYGNQVTLTATVSSAGGTPTGTVAFRDGAATIAGCGAVPVDGSGVATCATSALAAGAHTLAADFSGTGTFASSSGQVAHTVTPRPLTVTGPTLTIGPASPIPPLPPTYSGLAPGETAPAPPATCTAVGAVAGAPGTYPVVCSGATDPDYAVTYVNGTLTITRVPTTLTMTSLLYTSMRPEARLVRSDTGAPIAGQTIAFAIRSRTGTVTPFCTAVTAADGRARCAEKVALGPIALGGIVATYAGTSTYLPSSASGGT